jgi:tetratricopeptide (TPR) repeat protein
MSGPGPDADDWAPFVAAVAEHQRNSERGGAFLRTPEEIDRDFTVLETFHQALRSDDATVEELTALANSLSNPAIGGSTGPEIAQLRQHLARYPLRFSPVERPGSAAHLARSFARVSNLMGLDPRHEFLFATDYRYRPHASVQQWAQDRYLVLMSRFVVEDTWTLAIILAQLVVLACGAFPGVRQPWELAEFPEALLATAEENPYFSRQLAYGMCAAVEGERFRIAFGAAHLDPELDAMLGPVTRQIAAGAVDFLVGHELSHVHRGHLLATRQPAGDAPWFADEAFDRIRTAARGATIVEKYLKEYWPAHSRELEADLFGMMSAADVGAKVAQDLRLVGIQFAISLISFQDRANYLIEYGDDPAEAVGLREYNRLPGFVDLMLPTTTHPWGKTRATVISAGFQQVYGQLVDPAELRRKAGLMHGVASLLGSLSGPALNVIQWISRRPGEYLATVRPDGQLVTYYWPPGATIEEDHREEIVSLASRFYTDVAPDGPAESTDTDALPAKHAVEMIRRIAGPALLDGAEQLGQELGYQRLAIELAAAYVKQEQQPAKDYLRRLTGGHSDPQRTIALVCRVSLDRIAAEDGPLPEDVLRILAWYAPRDIPVGLLYGILSLVHYASDDDLIELTEDDLDEALGRLAAYALISCADNAISVHPRVQAVARTTPDEPTAAESRDLATRILLAAVPGWDDPADWPTWRLLLPHVEALADHFESQPNSPIALWELTAHYLLDQGRQSRAIAFFQRALNDQRQFQGPDHPRTLELRHSLGYAYMMAGDYPQAIALLTDTLVDQERVLSAEHPDVLTTRNSLAGAYAAAGDHARAIALFKRTIAERTRVLGRHHPNTLASHSGLAAVYTSTGDLPQAIRLLKKVAVGSERANGPDHPDSVISRSNLAFAYFSAGRLSRAIPLMEQALADHERVLGPDHPNTTIARNNLASAYASAGSLSRAIPLFEEIIAERERLLGPDHPDTLIAKHNLAASHVLADDPAQAVALAEQTLAAFERVLGPDHPNTLMSRATLADAHAASDSRS